jgi:protein-disulfide isomerase
VKYVVRDFPLERIHPKALKGHEAANCADEQGKYWEMHSLLFSKKSFEVDALKGYASELGLNREAFDECLDSGKYESEIRKNMAKGSKAGVTGTPAFYLGFTEPGSSEVKVTKSIKGAQPFQAFELLIEQLLKEKG